MKISSKAKLSALLIIASSAMIASSANAKAGDAKLFNCMDKKTFTMDSECMSKQISSNIAFKKAENSVLENATEVSDKAIATMTFNPKTLTIDKKIYYQWLWMIE